MQVRAEDYQSLLEAVEAVIELLAERDLLDDERVVQLLREKNREAEIHVLRGDNAELVH